MCLNLTEKIKHLKKFRTKHVYNATITYVGTKAASVAFDFDSHLWCHLGYRIKIMNFWHLYHIQSIHKSPTTLMVIRRLVRVFVVRKCKSSFDLMASFIYVLGHRSVNGFTMKATTAGVRTIYAPHNNIPDLNFLNQ